MNNSPSVPHESNFSILWMRVEREYHIPFGMYNLYSFFLILRVSDRMYHSGKRWRWGVLLLYVTSNARSAVGSMDEFQNFPPFEIHSAGFFCFPSRHRITSPAFYLQAFNSSSIAVYVLSFTFIISYTP